VWSHPPFAGDVAEGYIWGRGAIDDKGRVVALLEAVEMLLEKGFSPQRTLVFAFGHDEELGGYDGAARIAALLKERGLEFEFVLDEGGAIVSQGMFPGVSKPITLVGIAEKGYLSVELSVQGKGGHSSMPPRHTAIGILSSAIHRLEEKPFPSRIEGATRTLFESLATQMPFGKRMMLANLWLFEPLVKRGLEQGPLTNAMIRTTIAATMIEGGVKASVLPLQARAVVNLRLLPGDNIERALERVGQIVDDPLVKVRPLAQPDEPSFVSSNESWGFRILARTARQTYGDVLVAPFIIPFRTDSRHYAALSPNIYRLNPMLVAPADLQRIHGRDERISLENYAQCVKFYHQLIRNTDLS
jgi:carboxypeptidase PM20D1